MKINNRKTDTLTVVPIEKVLKILKELSFNLDSQGYEVMIFRQNKFPFKRVTLTKDKFISSKFIEYLADALNLSTDEFFDNNISE